jgi:hypothetical protein
MAGLKDQLEAKGYDTGGLDEDAILKQLEAKGYDTSSLRQKPQTAQQMSIQQEGPGLQPVPLMVPEQAPAQGLAALGDLASNPSAQGLQQASATAQGAQPQSMAGQIGQGVGQFVKPSDLVVAGTMPNIGFGGVKPSGPFTAGLAAPETALPGALKSAGQELGAAKIAARAGEDVGEAARLRNLLTKPTGIATVAEEGLKAADKGFTASTPTQLMAYREALGQMQAKGGTFANDYKTAYDAATQALVQKAPELAGAIKKYAVNALASGGPSASIPWLTAAMNPAVGATKLGLSAALSGGAQNLAGAGLNVAGRNAGPITSALLDAYTKMAQKRGQ